jgi:hypothetical protein
MTVKQTPKAEFMDVGKKTLPVPRGPKVVRGDEPTPCKIFVFGPWGSGKTSVIKGLLEHGLKVLCVTTDVGGSGTNSVKLPLKREGKGDLLANLYEIVLENDEQVQAFISEPTIYFPDIYEWDPDFLVWDGFAGWQQVYASEKIGSMPVPRSGNKDIPEAVEAGLQFEVAQWGMLRNTTFRSVHKFCALNNRKTGKLWHKVVTAQEGYKSEEGKGLQETGKPLLQGSGGILMGGAFDLIIRTKEVQGKDDKGRSVSKFVYQVKAGNLTPKVRGFELPVELQGDMYKLWETLKGQLGI